MITPNKEVAGVGAPKNNKLECPFCHRDDFGSAHGLKIHKSFCEKKTHAAVEQVRQQERQERLEQSSVAQIRTKIIRVHICPGCGFDMDNIRNQNN